MPRTRSLLALPDSSDEMNAYRVGTMADAMRVALDRNAQVESETLDDGDPDPYGYLQEIEHDTGYEVLAPHWKALPDDFRWVKRLKARARRAAVAKFCIQGYKVPEIAKKCHTSEVTVVNDIRSIQTEWRRSYLDDAELLAARDLDRLEYYLVKLAAKIEDGDVKAILAAVEIVKTRSEIVGYREGISVDIEQYVREVAEANGFDPDRAVSVASRISIGFGKK